MDEREKIHFNCATSETDAQAEHDNLEVVAPDDQHGRRYWAFTSRERERRTEICLTNQQMQTLILWAGDLLLEGENAA